MSFRRALAGLVTLALLFMVNEPVQASEVKVVAKKTAKPIPSPAPKWPPQGFKGKDGVYAKVPTSKELVGLLSAKVTLQSVVKSCREFACGAVIAAAETGCSWWEISSKVFRKSNTDPEPEFLGSLATYAKGSNKKVQTTIFLISGQNVEPETFLSQIKVTCHRSSSDKPVLGNIYNPAVAPTPTPTAAPTN